MSNLPPVSLCHAAPFECVRVKLPLRDPTAQQTAAQAAASQMYVVFVSCQQCGAAIGLLHRDAGAEEVR